MSINVVQFGENYHITFPYDYNVVQLVKQVPGRTWHPDEKYWSIPINHLGMFIAQFKGTEYEDSVIIKSTEQIDVNPTLDETNFIPNVDLSGVKLYVKEGNQLYSHQLDFMKYAIARENRNNMNGFLVCDEMGCVSGSAYVLVKDAFRYKLTTLRQLYQSVNWYRNSFKPLSTLSYDGRNLLWNEIIDVLYQGQKEVYELICSNNSTQKIIRVTYDHEILTTTGYKPAYRLNEEDKIICTQNNIPIELNFVKFKRWGIEDVYDIKMKTPNHNFVANDIVVHNCGKTLESIELALYNKNNYGFQHCLVICCVNMSKYNWQQEVYEQTNGEFEGYILGTRRYRGGFRYNGSSREKLNDLKNGFKYGAKGGEPLPYFLILNIEAVRMKEGKKYLISDQIIELINSGNINMIIIDEIHKNASSTSQQGKQLLRIKKATKKKCMWIPMTGTPIVNKPTDLYIPLRLIEAHSINSSYVWNKQFCLFGGYGGHEIVGYKNMEQLKMLLQPNMIRRLKENILDLPDKIEFLEYVDNSVYQLKLQTKIELQLRSEKDDIIKSLNPLSRFLRLRQVNGSPELVDEECYYDEYYIRKNAKLQRLLEILEDIHERGEKVIVFSNWVEPLRTIYRYISKKYHVCCYTGTMKEADRARHKEAFQKNPKYTVIIGTIGSLGTSHTLTAANNVIFYDEPWTAADRQQAIDRTHRLGATKTVNVYTLLSKDTVDERVHKILYGKSTISKYMVDNQLDIYNNPELFDILLGEDSKK